MVFALVLAYFSRSMILYHTIIQYSTDPMICKRLQTSQFMQKKSWTDKWVLAKDTLVTISAQQNRIKFYNIFLRDVQMHSLVLTFSISEKLPRQHESVNWNMSIFAGEGRISFSLAFCEKRVLRGIAMQVILPYTDTILVQQKYLCTQKFNFMIKDTFIEGFQVF